MSKNANVFSELKKELQKYKSMASPASNATSTTQWNRTTSRGQTTITTSINNQSSLELN